MIECVSVLHGRNSVEIQMSGSNLEILPENKEDQAKTAASSQLLVHPVREWTHNRPNSKQGHISIAVKIISRMHSFNFGYVSSLCTPALIMYQALLQVLNSCMRKTLSPDTVQMRKGAPEDFS